VKLQEPDVTLNGWVETRHSRPKGILSAIKNLFTKAMRSILFH
jgi:hypothetical protein